MAVIVTGCGSFIGRRLLDFLQEEKLDAYGIDLPEFDICDELPFQKNDVVIHLAAISTEKDCSAIPLEAMRVNIQGTLNVVRRAVDADVRQIIFASTEWVYGDVGGVVGEDDVANPNSLKTYAWTKSVGEQILLRSGFPNVTILRFGIVYGNRMKNQGAVETILGDVRDGKPFTVGRYDTSRRYIHVDDVCLGICKAIGQPDIRVYNLAGSRDVSLRDVISESEIVTGKKAIVTETKAGLTVRRPDSSLAKKELGWTPIVNLREGLARLDYYLEESK